MPIEKIVVVVVSLVIAVFAFYAIYLQGREQEFLGKAEPGSGSRTGQKPSDSEKGKGDHHGSSRAV